MPNKVSRKSVIIVAGGSGQRMGGPIPKQFLTLGSEPILMRTIERFYQFDNQINIILVLPQNQIDFWQKLCAEYSFGVPHTQVVGGATRFESVRNGLAHVAGDGVVGVHDGVRPLVSLETIRRCFSEAETYGTAVPVVVATESVRLVDTDGTNHAVERASVRLVQTPQVFNCQILRSAYYLAYCDSFTDDASVVEAAGFDIHLTEGNRENVKITTPDDLVCAESLLSKM